MFQNKEFVLNCNNIKEIKEQLILELFKSRKNKKITQTKLTQLTGLPQTTISRVESLNFDVTLNTLVKYAEAVDMELSITLKQKDECLINQNDLEIKNENNYQKIKKR